MTIKTNHVRVYEVIFAGNLFDDQPSLITDVKLENHGFESKLLRKGIPLIQMWPTDFTIYIKGSKPVDYLLCKGSYPIVSAGVKKIIDNYQMTGVEFLPVNIIREETKNSFAPYWVWNVHNIVDCLDWENTIWTAVNPREDPFPHMGIIKPAIKYDAVSSMNIFRIIVKDYVLSNIFISSSLKEKLELMNAAVGMEFVPIKTT